MLNIRHAEQKDLDNIAKLHAQSWRENYAGELSADYLENKVEEERMAVWQARFDKPTNNQLVLVAEINEEFCGFICAFGQQHPQYGTVVDNLHVKAGFKGQKIGTRLLNAMALWAKSHYANLGVYLEVLACNTKAIGFYQSLGAALLEQKYWDAPCGSRVNEYAYGWDCPDLLVSGSEINL